ncbi:MAG TPA: YbjN domain-containing protein [Tepidisphaeraceae bacterium]|nr:YbjN domain-containing protein [Tepidisphaeraceae bacterium]
MDQVRQFARELEHRFLTFEDGRIMIPFHSTDGRRMIETEIGVFDDGKFLQFLATIVFQFGDDHDYIFPALRMINACNGEFRWIKFYHNEDLRALKAIGDVWIMDGSLGAEQFRTMLNCFVNCAFYAQAQVRGVLDDKRPALEPWMEDDD